MAIPGAFVFDQSTKALLVSGTNNFTIDHSSAWLSKTNITAINSIIVSGQGYVRITDLQTLTFPKGKLILKASGNGIIVLTLPTLDLNKISIDLSGASKCTLGCKVKTAVINQSGTSTCTILKTPNDLIMQNSSITSTLIVNGNTMPHFKTIKTKIKKTKPVVVSKTKPNKTPLKKKTVKSGEMLVQYVTF